MVRRIGGVVHRWTIILSLVAIAIGFSGNVVARKLADMPSVALAFGLVGVAGFIVFFFSFAIVGTSNLIHKISKDSTISLYRDLFGNKDDD